MPILFFLLMLTSCCQPRPTIVTLRSDTIVTTKVMSYVPPTDSLLLTAQLRCDSLGRVYVAQLSQLSSDNVRLRTSLDSLGLFSQRVDVSRDTIFIPITDTRIHTTEPVYVPLPPTATPRYFLPQFALYAIIVLVLLVVAICLLRNVSKVRILQQ